MTQDDQEILNEIFLGKEDPDMAFKKPMTNNLKDDLEKKFVVLSESCSCGCSKVNVKNREGLGSTICETSCANCGQVLAVDELVDGFAKEPTIDWLIDEICPNKGNSPLMNFNKDRLKALINQKEKESRLEENKRYEEWFNNDENTHIEDFIERRIKQLKEELEEEVV